MRTRKQPRRIARELALLSLSQLKISAEQLTEKQIQDLLVAATRTITTEVQDVLETASAEVQRGNDRLLNSETRAVDVRSAKAMVSEALELAQTAINRLGYALDLPEFIQLADRIEVREYALEVIGTVNRRQADIDSAIEEGMVNWQLNRLPKIDRDILRIAVAEFLFLDLDLKFAINEAVELAKRYSDREGYRFINGVLRRVSDRIEVTPDGEGISNRQ